MHLFCIGIDPVLIATIFTRPGAEQISLDACRDLEEARQKLSKVVYDLYLLHYQASEAFLALLHDIRSENAKGKIAIVAPIETAELQALQSSKQIDYIIKKSHFEADIALIINTVIDSQKPKQEFPKLAELKRVYDESIPHKIHELSELSKAAKASPDSITELKKAVHKMAGSAGLFGYKSVTDACKTMETEIHRRLESKQHTDPQWLASLDDFLATIESEYKVCTFDDSIEPLPALPKISKPLLYVIDDDIHFIELLERIKDSFDIDLQVDFDPSVAIEKLRNSNFAPQGVVVCQKFKGSPLTGYSIIQATKDKKLKTPPVFALLLESSNFDDRFEAMEKGIDYLFSKPISAPILLKSMQEALGGHLVTPIKVLIVDDDPDFCDYVTAVLEEIGVSTYAIHSPVDLLKELEVYKPNILLLDILLPKYDGLSLLKSLRQDVTFKNLIIITVTGSEQPDTRLNAYAANVDDILFKPIDKYILQKRILSIANRHIVSIVDNENESGLPQMKELVEELTLLLKAAITPPPYLVLFEVEKFSVWAKEHNYSSNRDLIIFISNQLQWEADDKMKCYWYKGAQFGVVFENTDPDVIEHKIYAFLSRIIQLKPEWHLSFNCSIVPIFTSFKTVSILLHIAEESLAEARKKDNQTIKIFRYTSDGAPPQKKEIVIVDPNEGLLKILKHAFESHDIQVHTYREGGEALNKILSDKESAFPSLIIAERKLPDMDGMDLYRELKNRYRVPIPFFILTVFAADKDIIEGVSQGVEYIIKPFNIALVLQKAIKVISV